MEKFDKILAEITPVSKDALAKAQAHLDNLTKPPGSLGALENLARRYAAIRGTGTPKIERKTIFVFAADHGVTAEGVSAYPAEVTRQMVLNFLSGGAAINVLARHIGAEVAVVDIGVDHEFGDFPGLIGRKIARGTKNMAQGPSMSRSQAQDALQTGIDLARDYSGKGVDIFGVGDMGIGNTTASAAILAVYGTESIETLTGRGTGIDDLKLRHKVEIVKQAIRINRPDPADPINVLATVGGFEIAGIAGLILGAAASRRPVVIDGLISSAAAVIALKLHETVKDYIFTSHRSQEPGHRICFHLLDQPPLFDLEMRLGEGTGAALGISLVDAAVKIYSEMATFASAGIAAKIETKASQ